MPTLAPGADATAAQLLAWMFARHVEVIASAAPGALEGADPEPLHEMRTSTRRLRASLKICKGVLPGPEAQALETELAWLARTLGPVRDLDVLMQELPRLLGPPPASLSGLLAWLERRWVQARAPLPAALEGPRFEALLVRLHRMAPPELRGEKAGWPAADLLGPRLAERLAKLHARALAVGPDSPDEQLHRLRIQGKRLRYGCELAEPVLPLAPFAPILKLPHQLLGEHQDAAVASEWVRSYQQAHPDLDTAIAARWLLRLSQERRRLRAAFLGQLPELRRALGDPHAPEPGGLAAVLRG
jgi:CHAD domain-containing protein